MSTPEEAASDPIVHCNVLKRELDTLRDHLRRDIDNVADPQFKALCETSAEVVGALRQTFEHYADRSEPAWHNHRSSGLS